MTLEFFKLFQRNIEDDLNIIIPSNTDFLDELFQNTAGMRDTEV